MGPIIGAPEPIDESHRCNSFSSGEASLDDWLIRRAFKNEVAGASRTFVICSDHRVVGFYCLAAGSVEHKAAPGSIRRNMPQPIPAIVLGRLGIDREWQGRRLGVFLLRDAILRSQAAAKHIGARVLLVHALSEDAKRFYLHFGFRPSPLNTGTLMLPLADVEALLQK